ncbi:V-set and immunoglobulin domain-containing protein 10 [Amia ocellicauda]|uniref:V-set and immunoglobulin domain-containing protein 10 n=1 Tax=Amia ocellicauda TaxID=2972642 RepID=UPI0034647946
MRGLAFAFHALLIYATGAAEAVKLVHRLGTLGESVVLSCNYTVANESAYVKQWAKDDRTIVNWNSSSTTWIIRDPRFSIVDNGSLQINNLTASDENIYLCVIILSGVEEDRTGTELTIVDGPNEVTTQIGPTASLPNGTLYIKMGANLSLNCFSQSYPLLVLKWIVDPPALNHSKLPSGDGPALEYTLLSVGSQNQGNYSCSATNPVSNKTVTKTTLLLVYNAPSKHPECYSKIGNNSTQLLLHCMWEKRAYPTPTLHWAEEKSTLRDGRSVLNVSEASDNLEVSLNRSQLYDDQVFKCTGHHPVLGPEEEKSCSLTLKAPYPKGQPLAIGFVGKNVSLSCTEDRSIPVATTTWRRTKEQVEILPSSKYIISQEGPVFTLTIVNCSKEDEDVYFCRSENPIKVMELEVSLTIETSNTGAVIGAFIAVLIVAAGIFIGSLAYSYRDRICLGNAFRSEERNDVLELVDSDSDSDAVYDESVTRIVAVANGHASSLVQIHPIAPSDQDDIKSIDAEKEEENTHEEVLVTF